MARGLLSLSCIAAVPVVSAFVPSADYTFGNFIAEYGRNYVSGTSEYAQRKNIFEAHLKEVLAHNADPSNTWERGINEYADMTPTEFKGSGRLGFNKALAREYASLAASPVSESAQVDISKLPKSFDWRKKGVISQVKDQGHCGSCWAFGTTETVESHAAIATGLLATLSPQQLVSCAPNPLQCGGIGGCQGSIPEVAFNYIQQYGMTSEWMMPYTSYYGDDGKCGWNETKVPSQGIVTISGYRKLPSNDYAAVMDALVNIGPLAINVQADTWKDYHGGVFDGCTNYSNVDIDHVVQLVGYGTDAKLGDYWLVRNSWDVTWGEGGFIRLKRESSPKCGDDVTPSHGTGCKAGPSKQRVCGTCGLLFDASYPLDVAIPHRGHHTATVVV